MVDTLGPHPVAALQEKHTIEKGIQGTAVNNYGAFIETSVCLDTINAELGAVCDRLDMLLQVRPPTRPLDIQPIKAHAQSSPNGW
jgi:hypothetical protein